MRISDWSSDVCSSDLRDVEAPIAFVEQSRFSPAQCRSDRVGDFLYGQPVTRDHRAIEFHVEHRRTADLVRLHAARSGDRLQHPHRSEEHTSELQSLMRISYAVFCLKKKTK